MTLKPQPMDLVTVFGQVLYLELFTLPCSFHIALGILVSIVGVDL
jgi:hypothetical protein